MARDFAKTQTKTYAPLGPAEEVAQGYYGPRERYTGSQGGVWYAQRYINLMRTLHGLTVALGGPLDPLAFKFRGGMGLVMPTRVQSAKREAA
jgi:hypothetical protein